MNGILYLRIILAIILILIIIKIFKISKSIKYTNRINKYTVAKLNNNKQSFGDKISNKYNIFRKFIVKILNKSIYFKRKSQKYEKYSYIDEPLNIIATKFSFALIFSIAYIISAIYKSKLNIFGIIIFMLIGYFIYNIYLYISEKIRNKTIENDLLKAIMIMNNAFKSGYNITQSINIVSKDLTGPISDEFTKISNDLKYGLELKDVFDRFYKRVNIPDAKYITSSLSLLNITGGNLVGIFESIEKSFTNKKRINDELKSMTSSSRLVFIILLIMPILIVSLILILKNDYYAPLLTHPIGIFVILLAILLYFAYILIIRKVLKVDV